MSAVSSATKILAGMRGIPESASSEAKRWMNCRTAAASRAGTAFRARGAAPAPAPAASGAAGLSAAATARGASRATRRLLGLPRLGHLLSPLPPAAAASLLDT